MCTELEADPLTRKVGSLSQVFIGSSVLSRAADKPPGTLPQRNTPHSPTPIQWHHQPCDDIFT
ncbi:unnamed protein product [Musa hybrid cultivar]